jgi:SAM-dependent methyltransferase
VAEIRKEKLNEDRKLWDFHQIENRQSFYSATPRFRFLMKKVSKLKKIKTVLDIGFGDGQLLRMFSPFNYDLCGIDISEKNINETKQEFDAENLSVFLKKGSLTDIPFENKKFDLVIATEVLEHSDDLELKKGLEEIKRVLRDRGIFLGTVPAHENLRDNTCYCPRCNNVFHRWGHKQSFDEEKLKNMFIVHGFKIVSIKRLAFFGEQLKNRQVINRIKYQIKKLLFVLFKRIFAPQWWYFFEIKR